ncbi:MAG: hypothetical protein ACW981_06740 [Candidatus Hodarchaeales archaeon]
MRINNFKLLLFLLLLSIGTISVSSQIIPNESENLEYKVVEGDSMEYIFNKYFTPINNPTQFTDESGEQFNVTITPGMRMTVYVTTINTTYDSETAWMKYGIDGRITSETRGVSFLIKTTENRTYWENFVEAVSYDNGYSYKLEDDIITMEQEVNSSNSETFISSISYDIRTGWTTHLYSKQVFSNGTIFAEAEIEATSYQRGILEEITDLGIFTGSLLVVVSACGFFGAITAISIKKIRP